MKSAAAYAEEFLNKTVQTVSNVALRRYVEEKTGQTPEVVHGTLDCTGPGTLVDSEWYTSRWHKEKLGNGRVVHVRNTSNVVQREMNFDYENKRLACKRIMSFLPATGAQRVLTLASASGNCVAAALERNPLTSIDNLECDPSILKLWQARKAILGVKTNDFNCLFQDFVSAPGFETSHYALINADVMGYASKAMYDYLQVLNRLKNANTVAITTQCLNNFRNHGPFQDALRKKYANRADAHAECITDWLSGYTMEDRFTYQKDYQSVRMEVFIFQVAA